MIILEVYLRVATVLMVVYSYLQIVVLWRFILIKLMSSLGFELQRLQNEIEEEVAKYNQIDKKGQQLTQTRASLFQQENENALVLKEIELVQEDAKIYKQVGGVLIDQNRKEVKTTLSNRIAMINNQISQTNELIKKNEEEQKKMAEKIQKAKSYYYEMAQKAQAGQ